MSCIDEGLQEFVVSPLKEAKKDIDWIMKMSQRGADPRLMRDAIKRAGQKLRIADAYFEGLMTE